MRCSLYSVFWEVTDLTDGHFTGCAVTREVIQDSHAPWKTLNILEKKVLPGEP
jgi:hypothetical protein